MTKKATSQDVAAAAGVSQTAVSLILNNSSQVSFSGETRERVFAAARALDYHLPRRRVQREDASGRLLLILTPSPDDLFGEVLAHAAQDSAARLGWRSAVCSTFRSAAREKDSLEMYLARRADGILYTYLPALPHLAEQISLSTPTVFLGEKSGDLSLRCVELGCARAGELTAEHLLRLGHRRIAYLSAPFTPAVPERSHFLEGMRRRMAEAQLPDGPEVLTGDADLPEFPGTAHYEFSTGRQLTAKLLERGSGATALVGAGDFTAFGILKELKAREFRVPEDFSVCGFGSGFISGLSEPRLTSADLHLPALADAAVCLLGKKIRGGFFPAPPEYAALRPRLCAGDSSGPAPDR